MWLSRARPERVGYHVAERARRQPRHRHTVLVAMPGYSQESDRQRSRAVGFDHHLVKPVDFGREQEILATVSSGGRAAEVTEAT